ncbi:MAG: hypothetical protein ACPGFC_05785, partial [Paracoccaceae bacterium]
TQTPQVIPMAYTATSSADFSPIKAAPFAALLRGLIGMYDAMSLASQGHARLAKVEALNAKSDAELAALGLKREDIARKVFGDLYYI